MRGARALPAVVVAAIVGVLALAPATAGAHSARYAGRVTISPDPDFHGRVVSRSAACKRRRTVRVYRVEPGRDGLFVSVRSGSDGRWQYLSPTLTGSFYALMPRRVIRSARHRHVCNGDRSGPVAVMP